MTQQPVSTRAVKMGLHTSEQTLFNTTSFGDLKLRNPGVLEARRNTVEALLQNQCVQVVLKDATHALAYQQQMVDIHRMTLENKQASNAGKPGPAAGHTAKVLMSLLSSPVTEKVSESPTKQSHGALLSDARINNLKSEFSLKTIAAIAKLQLCWRARALRRRQEEEARLTNKAEVMRMKREAHLAMRGVKDIY